MTTSPASNGAASRKIVTVRNRSAYWAKLEWCAYFDGEEELGGYGYGETEQQAIDDLLEDM